jgi:hypothetical protein
MPSRDGPLIGAIAVLSLSGIVFILIALALTAQSHPAPAATAGTRFPLGTVSPPASSISATLSPNPTSAARLVPAAVVPPGWVWYQAQKDKFSYAYPPDWRITSDVGAKTIYALRAGGFWATLTDWSWPGAASDELAGRIEAQISEAGTFTGQAFTVLGKRPIPDGIHTGTIVEGELKSPASSLWLSYAYLRSYRDKVLVFYYFRERGQANGGDRQTFASLIASELDGDMVVMDKKP